jgi:ABC-type Zn2+ transport system substrate-binding protein/surface adhesin
MTREEELKKDGWERRATYDEPRLVEMMQFYTELGFEVRVEPFNHEEHKGCTECFKHSHNHDHNHDHEHGHDEVMTLYTRKKS